tara:strand:- start:8 stop:913 length:906 start_codon:yes stop_codon:yes gene_type:complete
MAKNLISISDLSKNEILEIIKFSDSFIDDEGNFRKEDLFPDKTIANVFCEPSTRTKSSFSIAALNLGCSVLDFDVNNSSIQKGETIYETIDALHLMGVDLCVLRHSDSVIKDLAEYLPNMTFVNAGEGMLSHPTQTLLDLKTIMDNKETLDSLKIVIVGDLDHSRVTSSFLEVLKNFELEALVLSGHPAMCTKYIDNKQGLYEPDLNKALDNADVVMALRIQHERFEQELDLDLETYKQDYQLTSEKMDNAKGDAIIMHPGPVNYIEITESIYDSEQSVIREQVKNGVAVRMSVLSRFLSC